MKKEYIFMVGLLGLFIGFVIAFHVDKIESEINKKDESLFLVRAYEHQETIEKVLNEEPYLYKGHVSYYSHSGCLGCSKNQIMGNGKPFKEMEMTLAVPCEDIRSKKIKYNTKVKVINQNTGKSIIATITDCGGFSKYNRVADLSKGLYEKIGAKTDSTTIVIQKI